MANDGINITQHAIERYQQRVEPVAPEIARVRIMAHKEAIRRAAAFGAPLVKVGRLQLKIEGLSVVTVFYENRRSPRRGDKISNGRPRPAMEESEW